jgi:hypothetical protein
MTYYQVEFQVETSGQIRPKRFRTEEKAKKHAKKVLGLGEDSSLESQANIVPVNRSRTPLP